MDTRVKPAYDIFTWSTSQHSQRLHVSLQDGFLFGPLVGVLLAQAHDGAQRLDVVAVAFGFGIDIADIVRNRLLFFFQPLDALDDGLELVFGEFRRGLFLDGGGRGGHRVLLNELMVGGLTGTAARLIARRILEMTLKSAAPCVKATSRSSTARPQEKDFRSRIVMPGLVPGIHVLTDYSRKCVDGRDKPGHDGERRKREKQGK